MRDLVDFLASLPLFRHLRAAELHLLASGVEPVTLDASVVLFRQGEPGDALYLVRSGSLRVSVELPTGDEHLLDVLETGEIVGEMAVLYHRPRAATVRAATACTLLKIAASALDRLFATDPSARTRLLNAAARRLPSLYLASVPMFSGLDEDSLRELDIESNWARLAGGQTLFRQGEPPDYVYVVVRGRLEVLAEGEDGRADVVRHLGHGDLVGEVAIFTGEPRNATVRAIRDTELVRLSKADVFRLLERHPRRAIEVVRALAKRVGPAAPRRRETPVSTIALVPAGDPPAEPESVRRLVAALQDVGGPTLLVNRARLLEAFADMTGSGLTDAAERVRVVAWLHEQEERETFVVFDCGDLPEAWRDFCLRQADLVLYVASPRARPSPADLDRRLVAGAVGSPSTPKVLVRLYEADTRLPAGTAQWLAVFPAERHHHVRVDRTDDYARVARYIAGKAIGLAVSGGGARTWAHVGVIRALLERGVPIDAVAGVSAGVFSASYYALGHDVDTIERVFLQSMENYKLRSDLTFPIASFLSGRKLVPVIQQMWGMGHIEDLWLPFFCLAANLTTARVVVLDRGPLWLAIRATTSVPGIHPPVCINGELLVDGGVLNNLPVDVMHVRCGGTVVASDVSLTSDLKGQARELAAASGWPLLWARVSPFAKQSPALPHIFEILARTATLSSVYHGGQVVRAADVYVRTPTDGVATFDWAAGTILVSRARDLALQAIDRWQQNGGSRQ
jgi:NTE family protein/lysophospholipid hydrolase